MKTNAVAWSPERGRGPAREGTALLQGLAICGTCGERMSVRYHSHRNQSVPTYWCGRRPLQRGESGLLSNRARRRATSARGACARYEADLAQRRFLKVDPDNRLVADALEADWNDKLRSLAAAQEAYEKAKAADANVVTDAERAELMAASGSPISYRPIIHLSLNHHSSSSRRATGKERTDDFASKYGFLYLASALCPESGHLL